MRTIADLHAGYRVFRTSTYPEQAARFHRLAAGQSPKIMIVACADSRADPATIFTSASGELFVVRNVANLVPPAENGGRFHGTSAGIEYAVVDLKVAHIVVMGHAGCGGIDACLRAGEGHAPGAYIGSWTEIAVPARERLRRTRPDLSGPALQTALEHEAIRQSLDNLATFDFVVARLAAGTLALHGAWFSIRSGELLWLEDRGAEFVPVAA